MRAQKYMQQARRHRRTIQTSPSRASATFFKGCSRYAAPFAAALLHAVFARFAGPSSSTHVKGGPAVHSAAHTSARAAGFGVHALRGLVAVVYGKHKFDRVCGCARYALRC
ncbi:hypothetical protein FOMPIDRAFT_149171 [Fomitopsis schrenkii]|uniref:Uncharacterized protein n=1 Tax=Fomitopsis schrenkii TaxID=2126942 RepID=S8EL51_FOMSC|nr:hypothetical protein FOMPIDRAFT_149171 [Fomitopsis schrenkii]